MPYISSVLSETFLQNFNYLNEDGKRNSTKLRSFFSPVIDNSRMTRELEAIANTLTSKIQGIRDLEATDSIRNESENISAIILAIKEATDAIFAVREKYAAHHTTSSGPGHHVTKYGERGWISNTTYISPKKPGFIESELEKALKVMKKDFRNKCVYDINNAEVTDLNLCRHCMSDIKSAIAHLKNDSPKHSVRHEHHG